jgi:hypothetical protein
VNQNDRELFIYRILSGVVKIPSQKGTIKIYPPSKEVYLESCEIYQDSIDSMMVDNIMDEEEMRDYMIENDLWSWFEEKDIDKIKTSIEDVKLTAYENRMDSTKVRQAKYLLKGIEEKYRALINKKNRYFSNTKEGIASFKKLEHLILGSTYINGWEPYDFSEFSVEDCIIEYNKFHDCSDSLLRESSRVEPWKTMWVIRKNSKKDLFFYPDRELTNNQKSLLAWSQTYDNVYESMDCPGEEVVNDDVLLDGWFIQQQRKREIEKGQKELDSGIKNEKIRNSQEVYAVVSRDKADKIESLNNPYSKMIKKQRDALLSSKGSVEQGNFKDDSIAKNTITTKQLKGKGRT